MSRHRFALAIAIGSIALAACQSNGVTEVVSSSSQTIVVDLGDEVHITLGNVGPGEYVSPPAMSSGVLTFIDVEVVPPFTPAGPNQRFRFRASERGLAVVHFRRYLSDSLIGPSIEDTVRVR